MGAVLLSVAVFGAVNAYAMQMTALDRLQILFPAIECLYVSPRGNACATVASVIELGTLFVLFLCPDFRLGVYGCALWTAAGLFYFGMVCRRRLFYSPAETFPVEHSTQAQK